MKNVKRIVAVLLVLLIAISMIPASAASSDSTPKEEVVYIRLNGDGSVKEIHVVNIFELDTLGRIVDYGAYESLRNMTTTDELGYANETVTIDAQAGRLYYEGKLKSNVMPWNIEIHYFMDGVEYTSEEIAGKSGDLKITLRVSENEDCEGGFFDGFTLQTTVALNTKKCTNISAPGATMANVGSKKQLTYTILPGKGANIEITAKVEDFELAAISLNGIQLKMNIEINDDTIQEKIDELLDGVDRLDKGAGILKDGATQLFEGTTALKDGAGQLVTGADALASGAGQLTNGLGTITESSQELMDGAWKVYESLCSAAQTVINTQLAEHGLDPITLTPKTYSAVLKDLLKQMDVDEVYEKAYETALQTVTAQVEARQEEVYAGYIESIAEEVYLTYLRSIADSLYEQVATQKVMEQLIAMGMSEEVAQDYMKTQEGKDLIQLALDSMTEAQKEQIIQAALGYLTDAQKEQIREGAVNSLTKEQKEQILDGYIDQVMKSQEVTDQITAAVAAANSAAASVTTLMGQLDSYSLFYEGLGTYTDAVDTVYQGAQTLQINMEKLADAVGTLNTGVGQIVSGSKDLLDGATQMKDGTTEFLDKTSGADEMISNIINSVIDSVSGGSFQLKSFVSEKNTNVQAVQFVIQTQAIEMENEVVQEPAPVENLTFWQKLLRLFGLY